MYPYPSVRPCPHLFFYVYFYMVDMKWMLQRK